MEVLGGDGTLSSRDFHVAARAFANNWKEFNSAFPPWTWVPSPKQPPHLSRLQQQHGYLSLEKICLLGSIKEDANEENGAWEEEEPESVDNATLVDTSNLQVCYYDFHIVYSDSYRVPVLYFRGYYTDGQPLTLEDIEKDLPARSSKVLLESKWTFITQEDYYIDAPVEVGDGFSFSGGKYSDGLSPSDQWFKQGKIVKAYAAFGSGEKAKDLIFGLTMGADSQASTDVFRAYSYSKVLPILSKDYHAIAFDWLGFGFSDKPQPKYGFDYTMNEFVASLESFINEVSVNKVMLVVQGYFAPVVVKYASSHQEKIDNVILLNPPDPLRASDKALESSGPYKVKEDDAMVYRNPYLTSGASGFALNATSRAMKKELKKYVGELKTILTDEIWKVLTTVCWGKRDRWLSYDGVKEFCKDSKHKLIEIPMAGHHVQEDRGEELGEVLKGIIRRSSVFNTFIIAYLGELKGKSTSMFLMLIYR